MNLFEHSVCSSSFWRHITHRHLLPWLLSGSSLGDHVLEIGAGYGAATGHLQARVPRLTSLDIDYNSVLRLKSRSSGNTSAVCGDATRLPFASQVFSSVLAILVLHHLKSAQLQDQASAEVFRVLRPGGSFIAFEISDSWIHRVGHFRSTFTPIISRSVVSRLNAAGFSDVVLDARRGAFRFTALRSTQANAPT